MMTFILNEGHSLYDILLCKLFLHNSFLFFFPVNFEIVKTKVPLQVLQVGWHLWHVLESRSW